MLQLIAQIQENAQPKHINDMFVPKADISIAEPIDVQIYELGNSTIQVYQLIGIINDERVGGLESLLNHMSEHFFNKDDPAINEHHFRITKKRYNEETHTIYNIDKTETCHIKE